MILVLNLRVNFPELIWDGELDAGSRVRALSAALESNEPPAGIAVALTNSHSLIEVHTRSFWAVATWAVAAIMVLFGIASENWTLVALSPFMMAAAVMQSWGKISIVIRDGEFSVFEGVGGVGRRIKMALAAIQQVQYAVKHGRGGSTSWVVLKGAGCELKFGRHLTDEQIRFTIAVLLDAVRSLAS